MVEIEIKYIPFDEKFRIKRENFKPLLHCKVPIPPYRSDEKFDINWHLSGRKHALKMLLWKQKMKFRISK